MVPRHTTSLTLHGEDPQRIVYVSCNPTGTFVEDALALCSPTISKRSKRPGLPFYPVRSVAVDMFPHTPHCELVTVFERAEATPWAKGNVARVERPKGPGGKTKKGVCFKFKHEGKRRSFAPPARTLATFALVPAACAPLTRARLLARRSHAHRSHARRLLARRVRRQVQPGGLLLVHARARPADRQPERPPGLVDAPQEEDRRGGEQR